MKRILILFSIVSIYSCLPLKKGKIESVFITRGYYFVIQIQSVKSDTIFFNTIEIYSPSPILDVSNTDTSIVHLVKIPLENFNMGYLKGIGEKNIGEVMLLYTKSDWINSCNYVKFDYINHLKWTDLSKMYRLGERK